VLEKAADELLDRQATAVEFAGAGLAVAEGHPTLGEALQPAVGEGHAEEVAGEVVEHRLAGPRRLGMDDPPLAPGLGRNERQEAGLAQVGPDLGPEEDGQGPAGQQAVPMAREAPGLFVFGEAAGGDEQVDVRVVEQGPGPGVQDAEQAGAGAEVAGIGRQGEQGLGRRPEQEPIEELLVGPGDGPQLGRQGEGHQEVETRQQPGALALEPAVGLVGVTLRTVTVAAGVIAVRLGAAGVALAEVAPEGGGATGLVVSSAERPRRRAWP
jgi:hypothetical protein